MKCMVCGEEVNYMEDFHTPHDPNCPNRCGSEDECECDNIAHADCCPDCNESDSDE